MNIYNFLSISRPLSWVKSNDVNMTMTLKLQVHDKYYEDQNNPL